MTPYTSPEGFHRHGCKGCGAIYEHADAVVPITSLRDVIRKHGCPNCGAVALTDYSGEFAPDYTTQENARCTGLGTAPATL